MPGSVTITVEPKPGRPGWFVARVKSTLPWATGALAIVSDSEASALRGALDALGKAITPLEEYAVRMDFVGHA